MPNYSRQRVFPLYLIVGLITSRTVGNRQSPRTSPSTSKAAPFLTSGNERDVKEFQKKLRKADLNLARTILKISELIDQSNPRPDDPMKVEERRIELETIVKGDYRDGIGWVWNNHTVPPPPSYSAYFERRKRIIRNGTWNPARKGWEYQGEFFGVREWPQ